MLKAIRNDEWLKKHAESSARFISERAEITYDTYVQRGRGKGRVEIFPG